MATKKTTKKTTKQPTKTKTEPLKGKPTIKQVEQKKKPVEPPPLSPYELKRNALIPLAVIAANAEVMPDLPMGKWSTEAGHRWNVAYFATMDRLYKAL